MARGGDRHHQPDLRRNAIAFGAAAKSYSSMLKVSRAYAEHVPPVART